MKKFTALLFFVALAFFANAQSEASEPGSIANYQPSIKKFYENIEVKNTSIVKDLVITPHPDYEKMYLSGNWGTIARKATFSGVVESNTIQFFFVNRVVKVGDAWKIYEEGAEIGDLLNMTLEDIMSKKVLVIAEFIDPFTFKKVKKNLELSLNKNSKSGEEGVLATAEITDEVLGVSVLNIRVENETQHKVFLYNRNLGISFVVGGNSSPWSSTKKVLAPAVPLDGVYPFMLRLETPAGISPEISVDLFVSNGVISFSEGSFNPLNFAKEKADFSGKVSMVKLYNERNEDVTVYIPDIYTTRRNKKSSMQVQTDAFQDITWKAYVIPSQSFIKLKLRSSSIKTIVYGNRSKQSRVLELGVSGRTSQTKYLNWYQWRSR